MFRHPPLMARTWGRFVFLTQHGHFAWNRAAERAFAPSVRRKIPFQNHTTETMAATALLIVLSIIAIVIALNILWRVLMLAIKIAFVLVLVYLFVKAVVETIWGLAQIAYGVFLYVIGAILHVIGSTICFVGWAIRICKTRKHRNTLTA